jgi:hypothetical protein
VDNGIRVLLIPEETIKYPGTELPYLGYFVVDPDGETAALCCAMLNPSWEEVLIHEYNHALQWIEESPAWDAPKLTPEDAVRYGVALGSETLDVLHRWADHELELEPAELKDLVDRSIQVELDCEQRTARMGLELGWSIYYHAEYVKKCNAYLRSYRYVEQTRSWPDDRESESVLALMPETFTLDYFGPLSEAELAALAEPSPEEEDETLV